MGKVTPDLITDQRNKNVFNNSIPYVDTYSYSFREKER